MVLFLTIVFGLMSIVYGVVTAKELLAANPGVFEEYLYA